MCPIPLQKCIDSHLGKQVGQVPRQSTYNGHCGRRRPLSSSQVPHWAEKVHNIVTRQSNV